MKQVDLHIHSTMSDGSDDVQTIVEVVKHRGLQMFSITDHDTFQGYEQLKPLHVSIPVIKGIEISCEDETSGQSVHVLGYGFGDTTDHVDAICKQTLANQQERSLWQLAQLQQNGYYITLQEVMEYAADATAIYKQHIMQVLIDHGYAQSLYGTRYQQLFKHGGICDQAIQFPGVQQVIEAIHQDHGIAVLAHPCVSKLQLQMDKYVTFGLDGIETYHSAHTREEVDALHAFAQRYELMETGGSDYHGIYGNEPMIGEGGLWRSKEEMLCIRKLCLTQSS